MRALLVLLVWLVAVPALADEPARVRVETEGECPSSASLATALATLDIASDGVGDAAWVVRAIHPARGATRFELYEPGGSEPVERRSVASPDCDALAQTFALIVHTHFTELGLQVAAPTSPPVAAEPPALAPTPAPVAPAPAPPLAEPPTRMRWELGLGFAAGLSLTPLLPSLLPQIDGSWLPESHGPFVLRVAFAASLPTTQSEVALTRWTLRPALGAGARISFAGTYLEILGGVLLDLAAITALDVPLFWRAQPALELVVALGVVLDPAVAFRFDLSAQLYVLYDRYLVDPEETLVATSPRASALLRVTLVLGGES